MNELVPFLFQNDKLVRVVTRDGKPWFVASDLCRILGIKQATRAVEPLDEDEKGVISNHTPGGVQDVLVVCEGGLYTLILRSRAAMTPGHVAHKFRRWVTSELLPTVRKTGRHDAKRTAEETKSMLTKLQLVREARIAFGKQAARKVWFETGLLTVPEMFKTARQGDFIVDLTGKGPGDGDLIQ